MLKPKYIYYTYIYIYKHSKLHIPVMLGVDKLQLSKCVARNVSYDISKKKHTHIHKKQIILTNCERYYYTKSTYIHAYICTFTYTYIHIYIHIVIYLTVIQLMLYTHTYIYVFTALAYKKMKHC